MQNISKIYATFCRVLEKEYFTRILQMLIIAISRFVLVMSVLQRFPTPRPLSPE